MYEEVENLIQYHFKDKSLIKSAFTHSSYVYEEGEDRLLSNERLEFLGDAVLELVVSHYLYEKYPRLSEGELTKFRAASVCEQSLAKQARRLNIGSNLLLGKGEDHTGGRTRSSTISDALEAIIGAVYLDGGLEEARSVIIHILEKEIAGLEKTFDMKDPKTFLQELMQKDSRETVIYQLTNTEGPAHNRVFTVQAVHHNILLGQGQGKSKKEAEQNAAYDAIDRLSVL